MDIKNNNRTRGLSLLPFDCQACVLRHSSDGTIYLNQGDLVLSTDMDACKTNPEPYIAAIKLVPNFESTISNCPIPLTLFSKSLNQCSPEIISYVCALEID